MANQLGAYQPAMSLSSHLLPALLPSEHLLSQLRTNTCTHKKRMHARTHTRTYLILTTLAIEHSRTLATLLEHRAIELCMHRVGRGCATRVHRCMDAWVHGCVGGVGACALICACVRASDRVCVRVCVGWAHTCACMQARAHGDTAFVPVCDTCTSSFSLTYSDGA